MELLIDGVGCALGSVPLLQRAWSHERLHRAEAWRSGRSLKLFLPRTALNDQLFGYPFSPHAADHFNRGLHEAELRHEGVVLHRGTVRLLRSGGASSEQFYHIEIRGGAALWAKLAARLPLDALPVECSVELLPSGILSSWQGEAAMRMLPMLYEEQQSRQAQSGTLPVERILSVDDYHPFLHLATLVEAIFRQGGYRLESNFLGSDYFRSLYMSGAFRQVDTTALKRRYDFRARRSRDVEAVADASGRVYATPSMLLNTVGNLVDALSPEAVDQEGNPLSDCFSAGGHLSMEENELLFRPSSSLKIGFEYKLCYESDYRILSRERLTGFDGVYLGVGVDVAFQLANRFEDRRGALKGGSSYRAIRFDHREGEQNRLMVEGVEVARFESRSMVVVLPEAGDLGTIAWQVLPFGEKVWQPYAGDWALYDGHVEERGVTEVELTLHTPGEELTPTSPKRFDRIYFYGAEPGMRFSLLRGTQLRPIFSSRPAYGEQLTFKDVACHGIRQSELLDALCHLFNLVILSDEERHTVRIEPEEAFYAGGEVVDWSLRQLSEAIPIEEQDNCYHEARRYGYRSGEGFVERFNEQTGEEFSSWRVERPSLATIEGCEEWRNALFYPTLSRAGDFAMAPSALIPLLGSRTEEQRVEAPEILPRILRYEGLKPLPEGEQWGWPHGLAGYPLAAFHLPEGVGDLDQSLCFEDRDGKQGLFRFWSAYELLAQRPQEVELELRLSAEEVVSLERWGEPSAVGCNARFGLRLEGEMVYSRLSAIEAYDAERGVVRCRFTLLPDDRP
uniref:hypothetical protein n=1 Tax=Alistipes sp. TaxID=1872444 RepID=UPI0040566575